ncbi:hypothetical protein ONZ45_g19492 [Pleurotus djamor]|nr:hypothetical protein ONZ45_g19492 [Pleurotus djamor]
MDDALELPNSGPTKAVDPDAEDGNSSGEEDAADWTKLAGLNVNRPSIPRRGEKEFEPAAGGGSGLQLHVLDRARNAMVDALKATRSTSSKTISYGIWYPSLSRAHVTLSRGIHFSSMGHSAARVQRSTAQSVKRPELLPEEAIYLIERGALFCWKRENDESEEALQPEEVAGTPMSVQQAYSEMIGTENLTLERYQVYSYLKRLGYVVTRAEAPTPSYPVTRPQISKHPTSMAWFLGRFFAGYYYLYQTLRFIPSGHNVPMHSKAKPEPSHVTLPYHVFFHIYKPATPFKKTSPPPPDFSLVVINARTTPMPTLHELSSLFEELPELPPPLPRQRRPEVKQPSPTLPLQRTWYQRWLPWSSPSKDAVPPRRPNPFAALKAGKKIIIIAAVDAGNISFFRFGQGAFEEWPMM